jgi:hypothetical protein
MPVPQGWQIGRERWILEDGENWAQEREAFPGQDVIYSTPDEAHRQIDRLNCPDCGARLEAEHHQSIWEAAAHDPHVRAYMARQAKAAA